MREPIYVTGHEGYIGSHFRCTPTSTYRGLSLGERCDDFDDGVSEGSIIHLAHPNPNMDCSLGEALKARDLSKEVADAGCYTLFASSCGIYNANAGPYCFEKAVNEELFDCVFRLPNVAGGKRGKRKGLFQALGEATFGEKNKIVVNKYGKRNWVHVEDVVNLMCEFAENGVEGIVTPIGVEVSNEKIVNLWWDMVGGIPNGIIWNSSTSGPGTENLGKHLFEGVLIPTHPSYMGESYLAKIVSDEIHNAKKVYCNG